MSQDWRMAKAVEVLRTQLNALYPNRDKSADGGIGDAAHASRSSDHNPWVIDPVTKERVVTARDYTNDPAHGMDNNKIVDMLVASRDQRIKYIIWNRRIIHFQTSPWQWRKYTGTNAHNHHFHLSVREEKKFYDDETPWKLDGAPAAVTPPKPAPGAPAPAAPEPVLRQGNKGDAVKRLQVLLGMTGKAVDGDFGPATKAAVKAFQAKHRDLVADGIAGLYTWKRLKGE